ncbi:MAG: oligoendopeptidase F, partial [Butyricicoccus sp.]
MSKSIPVRSACDPQYQWTLTDIFPSDADWHSCYAKVKDSLDSLRGYEGHLSDNADTLLSYLELGDRLGRSLDALANYAQRKSDEDTRNAVYQEMTTQFTNLAVAVNQADAFSTPELLAIPDDVLHDFYAACPKLTHYRLQLDRLRRQRAHTLSPECEALLASAGQLSQAPDEIFSLLNDADMQFPDALDSSEQPHPVTHGTFIPLLQSSDRTLRKNAFESLYHVYQQFRNTSAAILSAQMQQLQFFANARHYESALHAALNHTEVPVEIYHTLIASVRQNLPAMHRYVKLRKKLLGVDALHFYDLYTPIVADQDIEIDYESAKQMAREALMPLGQDYQRMLEEGFQNHWIDVYENQGKRSGAYSAGPYDSHPYVLLNYTNTLNDVFTLVHEMGHALHSYLSNQNQSVTYAGYVIFVAEVASTCNESLLMQHLLGQTTDKRRRAYLINYFLEQFRATLYRQTMFAEFELWCSEQTRKGQPLTAEGLSAKYQALNRGYYGADIVLDPEVA